MLREVHFERPGGSVHVEPYVLVSVAMNRWNFSKYCERKEGKKTKTGRTRWVERWVFLRGGNDTTAFFAAAPCLLGAYVSANRDIFLKILREKKRKKKRKHDRLGTGECFWGVKMTQLPSFSAEFFISGECVSLSTPWGRFICRHFSSRQEMQFWRLNSGSVLRFSFRVGVLPDPHSLRKAFVLARRNTGRCSTLGSWSCTYRLNRSFD